MSLKITRRTAANLRATALTDRLDELSEEQGRNFHAAKCDEYDLRISHGDVWLMRFLLETVQKAALDPDLREETMSDPAIEYAARILQPRFWYWEKLTCPECRGDSIIDAGSLGTYKCTTCNGEGMRNDHEGIQSAGRFFSRDGLQKPSDT